MAKPRASKRCIPNRSRTRNQLKIPEIPGTVVKMTPVFMGWVMRKERNISQKKPTSAPLMRLYLPRARHSGRKKPWA